MAVEPPMTWDHTFTTAEDVKIARALEEAFRQSLAALWDAQGLGGASGSIAGAAYWKAVAAEREAALNAFDRTGRSAEQVRQRARTAYDRFHGEA